MMRHQPRQRSSEAASGSNVLPVWANATFLPPTAAGMKPTQLLMPYPLSRAQFVNVRFATPPPPQYAANAPSKKKSAPTGRNWKDPVPTSNPANPATAAPQVDSGTNST